MEQKFNQLIGEYSGNTIEYKEQTENVTTTKFLNAFQIIFVNRGQMNVTINGIKEVLDTNMIAVIDCYDSYTYRHLRNAQSSILTIPFKYLHQYNYYMSNTMLQNNFIKDGNIIYNIIRQKDLLLANINEPELIIEGLVSILLGIIMKNNVISKIRKTASEIRRKIYLYVESNYMKPRLALDTISEGLNYSQYYFSHLFNDLFDCNVSEFINLIRCRHALDLMHDNNKTLESIYQDVGFTSSRTFYRSFEKFFGDSPVKYMKKIKQ